MENCPAFRSASMDSFPPLSGLGAATGVRLAGQANFPAADLPVAAVRVSARIISGPWRPAARGRMFDAHELTEMRHVAIV